MSTSRSPTALRALLLCQGVLVAGLALSFPFLTLYLHERRGLPMGQAGLAISAALVATAIGQGFGGVLSDLWGCKRVMAMSLAGRAGLTGLMAAAVARDWPVASVIGLHVGAGFIGNLYDPAVSAWIAHEHEAEDRVRVYGLLRVATNAAWAVGPAIGGVMAEHSYALLFAATSVACLFCLGLLIFLVPQAPRAEVGEGFAWKDSLSVARDGRYRTFAFLTVVMACSMAQLFAPFSVHATVGGGLNERQLGLLFALNGGLVVLTQQAASAAVKRFALTSAAAVGCLFYVAGFSWIGFAHGGGALALGIIVVTLGEVVVSPSLSALAANLAPEYRRGRYLGFSGLSYQFGSALGPVLGGLALEHLSGRWTPAPWLAAGALAGAAGCGFHRLGRRLGPSEQGIAPQEVA